MELVDLVKLAKDAGLKAIITQRGNARVMNASSYIEVTKDDWAKKSNDERTLYSNTLISRMLTK